MDPSTFRFRRHNMKTLGCVRVRWNSRQEGEGGQSYLRREGKGMGALHCIAFFWGHRCCCMVLVSIRIATPICSLPPRRIAEANEKAAAS